MTKTKTDGDRLLRTREVLLIAGVSRSHLLKLCKTGAFPAPRRLGVRHKRWLHSEVHAWIAERPRAAA